MLRKIMLAVDWSSVCSQFFSLPFKQFQKCDLIISFKMEKCTTSDRNQDTTGKIWMKHDPGRTKIKNPLWIYQNQQVLPVRIASAFYLTICCERSEDANYQLATRECFRLQRFSILYVYAQAHTRSTFSMCSTLIFFYFIRSANFSYFEFCPTIFECVISFLLLYFLEKARQKNDPKPIISTLQFSEYIRSNGNRIISSFWWLWRRRWICIYLQAITLRRFRECALCLCIGFRLFYAACVS